MLELSVFISGAAFASLIWIGAKWLYTTQTNQKWGSDTNTELQYIPTPSQPLQHISSIIPPVPQKWFTKAEEGAIVEPDRSEQYEGAQTLKEIVGE